MGQMNHPDAGPSRSTTAVGQGPRSQEAVWKYRFFARLEGRIPASPSTLHKRAATPRLARFLTSLVRSFARSQAPGSRNSSGSGSIHTSDEVIASRQRSSQANLFASASFLGGMKTVAG